MVQLAGRRMVPGPLRIPAKRVHWRLIGEGGRQREIARRLRAQGDVCERFRSPLYAHLLREAAADVEARGPCSDVLAPTRATAVGADDAVALRFMAAVHRLALEGHAPSLAAVLPSTGGTGSPAEAWDAWRQTVSDRSAELRDVLARTQAVQTNEVARCALLAPGFLTVARELGLPLRLLEVGASAGLNLRWDHYCYEIGGATFGDRSSPVRLGSEIVEGRPILNGAASVVERRGCDLEPVDPCSDAGQLTLLSCVWADQVERIELLRNAFEVAARVPVAVDRADGSAWLEHQLAEPASGRATVVFHSFVMQFLTDRARARFRATLARAGAAATDGAPLAWLRMEWGNGCAETRLTTWPGATDRLLATSTPQGWDARWLD